MLALARTMNGCAIVLAAALSAAAQPRNLAVAPHATLGISGTLVDSNTGQPIARARVVIAPVAQRNNFTTVITREDGRFSFENLAPGKYALTAQARGYLTQSFNQHDQFSSAIAVGPDLDSRNLLFRLPPEGVISGVVADEAGERVRDAQVMLYLTGVSGGEDATRLRGQMMANDEGVYHFGHLPPGRYLVAVSARPWYAQNSSSRTGRVGFSGTVTGNQGPLSFTTSTGVRSGYSDDPPGNSALDVAYPITFYSGVTDGASATPIVVGRGDKVTADIQLQPVPALHIRVHTENADSGHATRVFLEKRVLDGPPIGMGVQVGSVGQGEEEIVGLAPGRYTMRTYTAGQGPSGESGPSREIDVSGNGEIDEAHAGTYVPVTAKLQFDSGAPSGQATLQLLNKKTKIAISQRAGSDGELAFSQGALPGSYEVSVFSSSGIYLKSLSAAGAIVTGRTITVRPGNAVKLVITIASGQGQITGTALREGKPVAGAMIVLVPADPAHNQVLFRRDQSDSDGTFTLPSVVPGAYTLLAIENGWDLEWMKAAVLKSYMGAGATVQVQANGKYEMKVNVQ